MMKMMAAGRFEGRPLWGRAGIPQSPNWPAAAASAPRERRNRGNLRILNKDKVLSPAEEVRLYELSARFSRYFNEIARIDWAFSRDGRDCLVTCRVHARSGFYRVEEIAESFGKAIDEALEKVVRQRRRRKAMTETARRHSA